MRAWTINTIPVVDCNGRKQVPPPLPPQSMSTKVQDEYTANDLAAAKRGFWPQNVSITPKFRPFLLLSFFDVFVCFCRIKYV